MRKPGTKKQLWKNTLWKNTDAPTQWKSESLIYGPTNSGLRIYNTSLTSLLLQVFGGFILIAFVIIITILLMWKGRWESPKSRLGHRSVVKNLDASATSTARPPGERGWQWWSNTQHLEKSQTNQCDFASAQAFEETSENTQHLEKSQTNVTSVTARLVRRSFSQLRPV